MTVSWIPFISGLVELASCLMTFCLAASLSLITIALGWIWFRPALGGTLLALAVVPILLGNLTGNRQKSKSAATFDRIWIILMVFGVLGPCLFIFPPIHVRARTAMWSSLYPRPVDTD